MKLPLYEKRGKLLEDMASSSKNSRATSARCFAASLQLFIETSGARELNIESENIVLTLAQINLIIQGDANFLVQTLATSSLATLANSGNYQYKHFFIKKEL